jgi:hypothetical protein
MLNSKPGCEVQVFTFFWTKNMWAAFGVSQGSAEYNKRRGRAREDNVLSNGEAERDRKEWEADACATGVGLAYMRAAMGGAVSYKGKETKDSWKLGHLWRWIAHWWRLRRNGQLTVLQRQLMGYGGKKIRSSRFHLKKHCPTVRTKGRARTFYAGAEWGYFRLKKSEHECVYFSTVFVIVI